MNVFFVALILPIATSALGLLFGKHPRFQNRAAACGAVIGSIAGLWCSISTLVTGAPLVWKAAWSMPFGALSINLDSLSAIFLIPLFLLSALCAIYAVEYVGNARDTGHRGNLWFCYNTLVVSMAVVVTASNGLLFLVAWEIMSLSSFAAVLCKHNESESREAAWIYLIAMHIGAAFLLLFFLGASAKCGSLDFSVIAGHSFSRAASGTLFALGLVGFGSKAGFFPLHVWLPRAHPAAPSHVSALMSGIMIKMGIYGIVRSLTMLGSMQPWWGIALVVVGSVSGVMGVLYALGQHDLKRLLAFHSVENIGIIALGLGIGVLGICYNMPLLAALGFCGGLLHVVNHALFKGLLFLCAGSVIHATDTANIDSLGGLLRRMPVTAGAFLVGSIAICGLPPLNGFISEFLIYIAGFHGVHSTSVAVFLLAALTMLSLALIGGLAVACFTKAFGAVFLGQTRSIVSTHETGPLMRASMTLLALLCVTVGLGFWLVASMMAKPVSIVSGIAISNVASALSAYARSLQLVALGCAGFMAAAGGLWFLRWKVIGPRNASTSPTWDCGYIAPTPRMQYTSSSFAQPIVNFFRAILAPRATSTGSRAPFARNWKFYSAVPDIAFDRVYIPAFKAVETGLSRLRLFQCGKIRVYVLYIALTLVALLLWNFLCKS